MSIVADIQKLEPGAIIELYELDVRPLGGGLLYFHANSDQNIVFQGKTYQPYPIRGEGFALTSDQQPTPRISVMNLEGAISLMCLQYDDLVGAIFTRRRTFKHYLDGEPTANPNEEFPVDRFFVERKVSESIESVDFELTTSLDFGGVRLPRRLILANYCSWQYRGPYCNYIGPPVATAMDEPTSDPALDRCGHRLSSCKLRQWPDGVLNFGGFPAADITRF